MILQVLIAMVAGWINRMIFIGEDSLRYAINQYLTHYHSERNHQGLDKQWEHRRLHPVHL